MSILAWLREDWWRKLVALFFGWLIWYSVHLQLQEQEDIEYVPVNLDVHPELVLLDPGQLKPVTVRVRGSSRLLTSMRSDDVKINCEVPASAGVGSYTVRIVADDVDLPTGVRFVEAFPPQLTVQLETLVSETRRVEVRFSGKLPPGLAIERQEVLPREVTVRGPEAIVRGIDWVYTEEVALDGRAKGKAMDPKLALVGHPQVELIPEHVKLRLSFAQTQEEEWYKDLEIAMLGGDEGSLYVAEYIDPPRKPLAECTLKGPVDAISALTSSSIRPFVDLSGLGPGIYELDVQFWISARDCHVIWQQPSRIRVRIARRSAPEMGPPRPPPPNDGP